MFKQNEIYKIRVDNPQVYNDLKIIDFNDDELIAIVKVNDNTNVDVLLEKVNIDTIEINKTYHIISKNTDTFQKCTILSEITNDPLMRIFNINVFGDKNLYSKGMSNIILLKNDDNFMFYNLKILGN